MSKSIPLALDIDGTLIRNDLTHELFLKGVCLYPLKIFTFLYLALTSKPKMKALLISLVGDHFDASVLPYNETVINMAKQAKADGREVVLCSGSQETLISRIGDHFDWVDHSFGTTETLNLTKENKAAFLKDRYPQGFDYFGNSTQDYAVWKEARKGFAIEPPKAAYSIKSQDGSFVEIVEPRKSEMGAAFKSLRIHQWAKNLLIFLVPFLVINKLSIDVIPALILGFISMGLIASATYVFNDLVDIDSDRQHHSKYNRPFANGSLSIPTGVLTMIACGAIGFGIAFFLPGQFLQTLFLYFAITLTYSVFLKRQPIIDVLVLSFFISCPCSGRRRNR